MRIALLSYRSKPHCGGQGVYVRHLSRELVDLGHEVEVFSGQPYPELDPGVRLTKVPSLDLYREPDPFRVPRLREFRDLVDVEEFLTMCTGGFPEPKTFSTRVARLLRGRGSTTSTSCTTTRCSATGCSTSRRWGCRWSPPCTTRSPSTAASTWPRRPGWRRRLSLRRWYGFLRMQGKVARQARTDPHALRVLGARHRPDFGVDPARMQVILLGVDDVFRPPSDAAGAGPDPRDGQRRRPDEGDLDPARGLRQAAHRARPRAAAGHQAAARRPHRAARSTSSPSGTPSTSSAGSATRSWSR